MNQAKAIVSLRGDAVHATPQDKPDLQADSAEVEIATDQPPPCFRTDERYFCTKRCRWAKECKKLIAEWLR